MFTIHKAFLAVVFVAGASLCIAQAQGRTALQNNQGDAKQKTTFGESDAKAYKILYDRGVVHALAGRHQEAIKAFEQALLFNPKDSSAIFSMGNIYSDLGRWPDAVEAYQKAIRFSRKGDGEAHNNLGIAYLKLESYDRAAEAFRQAIRIHPTWAEPHYNLSNAYAKLGRREEANVFYREAVRLSPAYAARVPPSSVPKAQASGGVARSETDATAKKTGDALPKPKTTEQVTSHRQKDAKEYYNLGVKHGRSKKAEEAVGAFKQAILLKPDYADAHFGLGHAYADLGRWKESAEAYEQVVRLDPKDEEAYQRLGEAYAKLRAQTNTPPLVGNNEVAIGEKVVATVNKPSVSPSRIPGTAAPEVSTANSASLKAGESITPPATLVKADEGTAPKTAAAPEAVGGVLTEVYRVGAGDVLDVRLTGAPVGQSTLYTVTEGGLLDYPLLGEPLKVAGLTCEEIAAQVTSELVRRAVVDGAPQVSVSVREYTSHAVIVSGLVSDPGTKVLRREAVPLYVVIADAQPKAEAGRAVLTSHHTKRLTTVDLSDPEAMNVLVKSGDVVSVETRPQQFFYIAGEVIEPGEKPYRQGMTLTQAILTAGGLLSPAEKNSKESSSKWNIVKVTRQGSDEHLNTTSYNLRDIMAGKTSDPRLQPGDRIQVGN